MTKLQKNKNMEYECPNCKTRLVWDIKNPHRPFCSERCKNIDLVAWANEKNRVPDNNPLNDLDFFD
jgi:uncharacterized protein